MEALRISPAFDLILVYVKVLFFVLQEWNWPCVSLRHNINFIATNVANV